MAEVFEDIYSQAEVITNGHVELLSLTDFNPTWASFQLLQSDNVSKKYRVLPTDSYASWSAAITRVQDGFKSQVQPVPNYFQNCGGNDVIERISSSTQSYIIGDEFYHPAYYIRHQSPLRPKYLKRKNVLGGVSVSIIY